MGLERYQTPRCKNREFPHAIFGNSFCNFGYFYSTINTADNFTIYNKEDGSLVSIAVVPPEIKAYPTVDYSPTAKFSFCICRGDKVIYFPYYYPAAYCAIKRSLLRSQTVVARLPAAAGSTPILNRLMDSDRHGESLSRVHSTGLALDSDFP